MPPEFPARPVLQAMLVAALALLGPLTTGASSCQSGDQDGDGYTSSQGDCDDSDPGVYPGAIEYCDGRDNDCDGIVDEDASMAATWYPDTDGDGFGGSAYVTACSQPAGYVTQPGDCDDTDSAIYPGAREQCDGIDNDCDGQKDDVVPWYVDQDGDGFGSGGVVAVTCQVLPGHASFEGDCNDADASIYPGAADPVDGIDRDCGGKDREEPCVGLAARCEKTLQGALDTALAGETVFVGPGTYLESALTFRGNRLTLASVAGPERTVIDGSNATQLFTFSSSDGPETVLRGFTLRNGSNIRGGAVAMQQASPTLEHLIFEDNYAPQISNPPDAGQGGAIYMVGSSPTLRDCRFSGNLAALQGGALYLDGSSPHLTNCILNDNRASGFQYYDHYYGGVGGAVVAVNSSAPVFDHCLLSQNLAQGYYSNEPDRLYYTGGTGGGLSLASSSLTLTGCVLTNNQTTYMFSTTLPDGGAVYASQSTVVLEGSVVTGNTSGLYQTGGSLTVHDSILAYNPGRGNLWIDSTTPATWQVSWSDLYEGPGQSGVYVAVDASNITLEPGFLAYDAAGVPATAHLARTSMLVDAGDPAEADMDGSRRDLGAYGGPAGDQFDLDLDGYPDWFWPGMIQEAPAGFDPAAFDCDDLDPAQ